jgi:hypothetical protein
MLNEQLRTTDKGWSSSLGAGRESKKSSPTKNNFVTEYNKGPRTLTDFLDKRPKLNKINYKFWYTECKKSV